jgi:hypothetical protein
MRQFARFHWLLLLAAGVAGVICWMRPSSPRAFDPAFSDAMTIQAGDACVMRRLSLKILVTKDLIDRRITLDQAAIEFEDINSSHPKLEAETCRHFPAETSRLSHALQALNFAQGQLDDSPSSPARLAELEEEFARLRANERNEEPRAK